MRTFERLEWLRASSYTKRYHGWRILLEDTVGQHQCNVANLLLTIWPDASRDVLIVAIRHDAAEWIVGDMPAPSKRRMPDYPEYVSGGGVVVADRSFRQVFGEMEDQVLREAGIYMPEYDAWGHWQLKFCDALDGAMFCMQEMEMGNTLAKPCYEAFVSYMRELLLNEQGKCPEANPAQEVYNELALKARRFY